MGIDRFKRTLLTPKAQLPPAQDRRTTPKQQRCHVVFLHGLFLLGGCLEGMLLQISRQFSLWSCPPWQPQELLTPNVSSATVQQKSADKHWSRSSPAELLKPCLCTYCWAACKEAPSKHDEKEERDDCCKNMESCYCLCLWGKPFPPLCANYMGSYSAAVWGTTRRISCTEWRWLFFFLICAVRTHE